MAASAKKTCVHCKAEGLVNRREAKYPGPSCYSHRKRLTASRSSAKKDAYVLENYGITGEEYNLILKAQGGVCYICHKKPGRYKRLSVDHDHKIAREQCDHPVKQGCRRCVRGLLHSKCNSFLGWINDEVEAFERGKQYLLYPPARAILFREGT